MDLKTILHRANGEFDHAKIATSIEIHSPYIWWLLFSSGILNGVERGKCFVLMKQMSFRMPKNGACLEFVGPSSKEKNQARHNTPRQMTVFKFGIILLISILHRRVFKAGLEW